MTSIYDTVLSDLGDHMGTLGKNVDADEQQTKQAVEAALPVLIGALSRNAAQRSGAEALARALDKDHDGSILKDLGSYLERNDLSDGNSILGHALGARRDKAEQQVSQLSGLNLGSSAKLLAMLAPLIMGALGKLKSSGGINASGLGKVLRGQKGGKLGCLAMLLPLLGRFMGRR